MIIWGVNALNHDASITVVDSSTCEILFAAHAERYSRIKNDVFLNEEIVDDALHYGHPQKVVWFENPWGRRARYLRSGQWNRLFETFPKGYLNEFGIDAPVVYSDHHASHAAGGYFTSGWDSASILVVDAIGELTTASIWKGEGNRITKLWELRYPNSIGLFYSAITHLVGLKPNEEEYILMGMAAYGDSDIADDIVTYIDNEFYNGRNIIRQSFNFHKGIEDDVLKQVASTDQGKFSLALAAQKIVTSQIQQLIDETYYQNTSNNLVYSGGVALNCVANSEVVADSFDRVWIMPNPGDAGNSLGAVANYLKKPLKWRGPFLGHRITRPLYVDGIINELMTTGIVGVANGKAEFGPRALGNRSLLADPRRDDIKDKVNKIKRRQEFRPFAPAVLAEHAHKHFRFPGGVEAAPYMQYVVGVIEPHKYPAIAHVDNTARVQTVDKEAPNLKAILEQWYEVTGCPILLNTSLNIKGEPLVNTIDDATRWQEKYGVRVF